MGDRALASPGEHASLQDLRTYHLPRPADAKGWGTMRLQLGQTGVVAVQQASGDASLKLLLPALWGMQFPGLVPPDSQAHLLRSGVVSCSQPKACELVLVPNSTLQTEQQQ